MTTADDPSPPSEPTDLLLRFVEMRDEPCPVCGYSLRGLAEPICPECAATLELRIGSPQVRLGPWVLAVVSCALALGFDGVTGLILLVVVVLESPPTWHPFVLVGIFLHMAAGMAAAMLALIAKRHAWMRLPRPRQWAIAGAIFVTVGALHALFGLTLYLVVP